LETSENIHGLGRHCPSSNPQMDAPLLHVPCVLFGPTSALRKVKDGHVDRDPGHQSQPKQ
jgi:hypothetical protein